MDNPSSESSTAPLNIDGAAAEFAALLDPQPVDSPEDEKAKASAPEPERPGTNPAEPAEPVEPTEPDDPLVTVKIDGKEVEVKLSELKSGYQRQSDYTRKTMETAEQRKAAEAETQRAMQERHQYAQNLQRMAVQLESALQQQSQIDWQRLIDENPQEAMRQQHLMQVRQAQYAQTQAEQHRIAAIAQAEQAQRLDSHLRAQHQELLDKLPDWKDDTKAKAEKAALRDYLFSQGFDAQAVSNVSDAKAVLMARKAMLYDQMVSKAQAATKKVATLPTKVERPGTGTNPGLDKRSSAFQRLSKSGRVEDAAAVFASFL